MPAVLSSNLHSGFLNEEYGLYLLRQISAVAPIGRAEDHGIDAIATLLPAANGFLHAADSFLIQFKSESVKTIEYGGKDQSGTSTEHIVGELHWLRSLQVPLLFGSVSRIENGAPGRLRIHASEHLLRTLFLSKDPEEVVVCFDPQEERPTQAERTKEIERIKATSVPDGTAPEEFLAAELTKYFENQRMVHYLGPPVVEYGLVEIQDRDFRETIIAVLQGWVRLSLKNLSTAPLGIYRPIEWKTNEAPVHAASWDNIASPGDATKSRSIWEACHMPLEAFLFERMHEGTDAQIDAVRAALEVLREAGMPVTSPDDLDYLRTWARDRRK